MTLDRRLERLDPHLGALRLVDDVSTHIRVCYSASMTRPGRTKTTSFSLDGETLSSLKALARRRHKGNVSALLAEFASREAKFAAADAFFKKYGVAPLNDAQLRAIEAEWQKPAVKKRRRRQAA